MMKSRPAASMELQSGGGGLTYRRMRVVFLAWETRLVRHHERAYILSSLSSTATTILFAASSSINDPIMIFNHTTNSENPFLYPIIGEDNHRILYRRAYCSFTLIPLSQPVSGFSNLSLFPFSKKSRRCLFCCRNL